LTCHGIFPPPSIRVRPNLRTDNVANEIHGRTDHRHPEGAPGGIGRQGTLQEARHPLPGKALRSNVPSGSDGTFYKWRSKYGSMEVSEANQPPANPARFTVQKAMQARRAAIPRRTAERLVAPWSDIDAFGANCIYYNTFLLHATLV